MDNSELQPIVDFIRKLTPFDSLPKKTINQCCQALTIVYYGQQQKRVSVEKNPAQLYIVRSGAFEVTTKEGKLIDRIAEGQFFGFSGMLSGEEVINQVHILEDGLVYHLPAEIFNQLRSTNQIFDRFFNQAFAKRLRNQSPINDIHINTARVSQIMSRDMTTISPEKNIHQAALLMSEKRLSSLLVVKGDKLCGIITDRDLRSRVLAKGLDGNTLISQVMTKHPITIEANALIFEAMLTMSETNIHHLPVVENNKPIAIVTNTDLIRNQSSQPLFLIGEIERQHEIKALIEVSKRIPDLLYNLIRSGEKATEIGLILTSVTDALTRRLIRLSQQQLGSAPMLFCWLAFGSQGRQDQMAGSDQDNALLLERKATEQELIYFKQLSESVCSALDACGFVFCPGNIMAQNSRWQLSLTQWLAQFSTWIQAPSPEALLNATIFFDMRVVFGEISLFKKLQKNILKLTKNNDIFIASMSQNALQSPPPLGFFRHFVLERDGSEVKGIDLKHKGNVLINDIIRIYALAHGIQEINTNKRIQKLIEKAAIDNDLGLNLLDAWEFIAHRRLINQGQQFKQGKMISNYILPDQLSSLVRHQLKGSFKVIHDAQNTVRHQFLRQF